MSVIYKFASAATSGLFAFTDDQSGTRLPDKHGPWTAVGKIKPDEMLPHRLDRGSAEKALEDHGYQLWRIKKRPSSSPRH